MAVYLNLCLTLNKGHTRIAVPRFLLFRGITLLFEPIGNGRLAECIYVEFFQLNIIDLNSRQKKIWKN